MQTDRLLRTRLGISASGAMTAPQPGEKVKVTYRGEGTEDQCTFFKISGTGHRVVRDRHGYEFALYPEDEMKVAGS